MLNKNFNYTCAQYASLAELKSADKSELEQADLITIRENISGGIYHSKSMQWWGNIINIDNPTNFIRSKRERKALPQSMDFFKNNGYEIKTIKADLQRYEEFRILYENTTLKKDRAIYYDLSGKLLGAIRSGESAYFAGLFLNDSMESALAFIIENKKTSHVLFGAKKKFKTRSGVGGVLEYELLDFCLKNQITHINHGAASNPAGIISNAGVFEFKTRYGFSAFPYKYWQTMFIKNQNVAISDLVFVTIIDNQIAYLVISDELEKDLINKYKTKEIDKIVIQSWAETKKQYDNFLQTII